LIRWGIVGLGRAGLARRRALSARDDSVILHECSRRDGDAPSLRTLLDSNIEAVALCRESALHYDDVRAALRADKHVLVEYPLALTHGEASELAELAHAKERVLHVGHFGLLNPFHKRVAAAIDEQDVRGFEYVFSAGFGRAIRPLCDASLWGQSANSRLQALWSWFGPLELESSEVELKRDGYEIDVHLRDRRGRCVVLRESRRAGQTRGRSVRGVDRSENSIELPAWKKWPDGFVLDTECFVQQVKQSGSQSYIPLADVVDVVALSESISLRAEIRREVQKAKDE